MAMNKEKIKRFYIMPEVWVTVTQSQVFNWIKLVNENGISTDCISITNNKKSAEDVERIEKAIKGNFIQVHDFRRIIVSDIYTFLVLLKHYFKNVFSNEKIIYQTRIDVGSAFYFLRLLPKVVLIFEARGAGNEENQHNNKDKKLSLKGKIKKYISTTSEKILIKKSHRIICVSNALRNYYVKKFKIKEERFSVFPGAADSDMFFYDEKIKKQFREKLGLNDNDLLMAYSGRLEMSWEIPDKIFDFFKFLNNKNENFKLLLITPDIKEAEKLIKQYEFENKVIALSSNFKEVNNYLNASDVGLLLREDVVMNNVASPTKFAEYLLAGLPVVISKGVYDFAEVINNTGYGIVVEELDKISHSEYDSLMKSLSISPTLIEEFGKNKLSKEVFIKQYIKLLKEV